MRTSVTPGLVCPSCHAELDRTSDPTGKAKPKVGDVSVCIRCGVWNVFEAGPEHLQLRPVTADELVELDQATYDKLAAITRRIKIVNRLVTPL